MESTSLKHKFSIEKQSIFYILGLYVVLWISYHFNISYNFLVLIIKCALSTLIIVLMANSIEKQVGYIYFISIGYIIVNIYEFIGVIYGGKDIFSNEIIIGSILIELIVFITAINYINRKDVINNNLLKIIVLLSMIAVVSGRFHINVIYIVFFLNLILLIYMDYKRRENEYSENIDEFINLRKIIILRAINFLCILISNYIDGEYHTIKVLSDTISVVQIYIIFKIIIYKNLIEHYKDILENNEKIELQNIVESNANIILTKMKDLQEGIHQELVYKEELYEAILDSSPNGLVFFSIDGEIREYNDSFRKIVGCSEDIKKAIEDNIINNKEFIDNALKVCSEKCSIDGEIITKQNKIFKCSYYINYEDDGCVCNLLDITQEKNILGQLVDLKEEYEDLIVNIKSAVYIFDESDNVINFSKSYNEFYDQLDLYQGIENIKINIDEESRYTIYKEDLNICIKSNEISKKANNNSELYNNGYIKYRVVDYLGNILWIELRTKIYFDDDKKYIMKCYSNITEYIKTSDYLEKTKNLYLSLLDSVPEAIYLEDLDDNSYAFINKKFRDIFNVGDDVNDLGLCRHDLMKVHPEYDNIITEVLSKIRGNSIYDYQQIKYVNPEGKLIDAKTASIPFTLHNKVYKLTIIKDMNDIKHLENLRRKIQERIRIDKMKMEFFVNMSHELKTPLNLIFTSTQLIENLSKQSKIIDPDNIINKHVQLTKQNSYRLLKITSDLIDFTKMESGFYKLRMENRDIISLVEDIVMSVATYAKSKEISLIFDTEIEELFMAVDINAIERILLNLLSNAIKFTKPGGNVFVNMIKAEDKICIEIEDTGIGIEEDKINLIFERFNDVNKGFIGNIYGSGIGLSMVKSIANMIKADVKVESKYGEGTKFTISIKIDKINQQSSYNYKEYNDDNITNVERLVVDMADIYS